MAQGTGVSAEQGGAAAELDATLRWPNVLGDAAGGDALEVALLWGDRPIDVRQFRPGEAPTFGDLWAGPKVRLERGEGGGRLLSVPEKSRVAVHRPDGSAQVLDADRVELEDRARVVVAHGGLRVAVRPVPAANRVGARSWREADFSFFKLAAICALMAAALLFTLHVTPQTDGGLADMSFGGVPLHTVNTLVKPKPPPKLAEQLPKVTAPQGPVMASAPEPAPRHAGNARDVGLLKAMKELGGLSGGVFAPGGLTDDIDRAAQNLNGNRHVAMEGNGFAGMGGRGTGPGGPGVGMGLDGSVGAIGGTEGPRGILIDKGPRGQLGPHVSSGPEKSVVVGGLDRDEIAKVIRRHQNEIKYCYENALSQSPDLEGKVAVQFLIGASGEVDDAQVAETTLENATAETCIVSRIRRWRFPEPRGGGVVSVNFPWLFRPAGTE